MFCGEAEQPQTFISETSYVKILFYTDNFTDQVNDLGQILFNLKLKKFSAISRHIFHLIPELNNKWKFTWDMVNIQNCIQIDVVKLCKGKCLIFLFQKFKYFSSSDLTVNENFEIVDYKPVTFNLQHIQDYIQDLWNVVTDCTLDNHSLNYICRMNIFLSMDRDVKI